MSYSPARRQEEYRNLRIALSCPVKRPEGLSDAQLRSLAYAMGHTVETLRKMCERCTPEQKRREIEAVINMHLFKQPARLTADGEPMATASDRVTTLIASMSNLSQQERKQLAQQLMLF